MIATVENKQMEQDLKEVRRLSENILSNIEKVGRIVERNRLKYGKRFMEKLPDFMPPSFWLACEMVAAKKLDPRLVVEQSQKATILKRESIDTQRDILDHGVLVKGERIPYTEASCKDLALHIDPNNEDYDWDRIQGKVVSAVEPYKVVNGKYLDVRKACMFTKADLIEIAEAMDD